ncbi:MAG TPA: protein arginine kinase [Bacillota bacterium]|nr:protein arginine kinase [Bacillota bacterium]
MSVEQHCKQAETFWMQDGPDQDVILSTRIRLARNLKQLAFPGHQTVEDTAKLLDKMTDLLPMLSEKTQSNWQMIRLQELTADQQRILIDKHLMSPMLAEKAESTALLLREDEAVSIMVNEEDHLRLQVLLSGLQLEQAWKLANEIDDVLEAQLEIAFSNEFGYITACPTNAGTGLRASVMVHLPALVISKKIGSFITGINQLGMVVRGFYGEGTEAIGHIFQISNQISLGQSEEEILANLQAIIKQVVEEERKTRRQLFTQIPLQLRDRIGRTLGILSNAWLLNGKEAVQKLSDLRLGVELDLLEHLTYQELNGLMVQLQPAWLNQASEENLSADQRAVQRAAVMRSLLTQTRMKQIEEKEE